MEKAAISIQRRYRVIYAALQAARAAERERVEKAKKKAEKDRKEGGLWWSGKIKNLPVPDHGKVYGNRTVETVHGWGSWIGERWVPLDDKTRPHKQRAPAQSLERALQVRADPALQERRRGPGAARGARRALARGGRAPAPGRGGGRRGGQEGAEGWGAATACVDGGAATACVARRGMRLRLRLVTSQGCPVPGAPPGPTRPAGLGPPKR